MNDQNFYVNNAGNNTNTQPTQPTQPVQPNNYQAPTEPQQSNVTFDYNQLYGNNVQQEVVERQAVVFEEPTMETTATIASEEPTINISNDELIPEFDASVLEVIPEQEKQNIKAPETSASVKTMAVGKQAERDKSRGNIIFIVLLFGVILAAVFFVFPILIKM